MTEQSPDIAAMYFADTAAYSTFKDDSFAWRHIERPAFDRYLSSGYPQRLPNMYTPDTKVLDLGCGTGVLMKHLISRGMAAQNITGIDISGSMLKLARDAMPEANFVEASADSFDLPEHSFDLVVSNMMFQYLDHQQTLRALDLVHKVLRPAGAFFVIMTDPDYLLVEKHRPMNTWADIKSPWGTPIQIYAHDLVSILYDDIYFAGFDLWGGGVLPISEEGKKYPADYANYASRPARVGIYMRSVTDLQKQFRYDNKDWKIPDLLDPDETEPSA